MKRLLPQDPRLRGIVVGVAVIVLTLVFTQLVMPGKGAGRGTPGAVLFKGLILGLCYAVFTTGMVLVYRAIRIVNFTQGPVGFAGGLMALGLIRYTAVPFPLAIIVGMAVSGAIGALIGVFMLRFFTASRLYLTVITIVAVGALVGVGFQAINAAPFFPDA